MIKGYSVPRDFSWIENYKLSCKKKGHFSKCCPNLDSKVDFVQQNIKNSDSDSELFNNYKSRFIGVVEDKENSSSENEWTIDLSVNQTLFPFKIDSGAKAKTPDPTLPGYLNIIQL